MATPNSSTRRESRSVDHPGYIIHANFEERGSENLYRPGDADHSEDFQRSFMPDEVTRDHARRMHYAAYRWDKAGRSAEARDWRRHYLDLRDAIVLGNRKLVNKVVRRWLQTPDRSDDLLGECHIVLIQTVEAYNPWLGIRFSTYAYTCLIRALSRQHKRLTFDLLARSQPLDLMADGGPSENDPEPTSTGDTRLEEFFRDDHPLLSDREKTILTRRFRDGSSDGVNTLVKVGKELGLSKERVRQVQTEAINKLRVALAGVNKF